MSKPIKTIKHFTQALRIAREKKGIVFHLYAVLTRTPDLDGSGYAEKHCIWHRTPSASLVSPERVLAEVFFHDPDIKYPYPQRAAELMGLPLDKLRTIHSAVYEDPGFSRKLRRRLIEAAGLKEIPHSKRQQFREKF